MSNNYSHWTISMVWFALYGCESAGAEMSMLSSSLRVWWCSEHNWRFLTISRHSILLSISNTSLSWFQYFLRKFEFHVNDWIAIRYSCGINNQFIDIFNKFSWPLCEHYFSSCSPLDQTSHLIHPNEHYIFWLLNLQLAIIHVRAGNEEPFHLGLIFQRVVLLTIINNQIYKTENNTNWIISVWMCFAPVLNSCWVDSRALCTSYSKVPLESGAG